VTAHQAVIALAVAGGVLSLAAPVIASRGEGARRVARWLNGAAYGFMGASMVLFITAGFLK
jgi:hypothetical protein